MWKERMTEVSQADLDRGGKTADKRKMSKKRHHWHYTNVSLTYPLTPGSQSPCYRISSLHRLMLI